MSYVKTTWQTGDIVTADKLNKMEQGIQDASESYPLFVDANNDGHVVITIEQSSATLLQFPTTG